MPPGDVGTTTDHFCKMLWMQRCGTVSWSPAQFYCRKLCARTAADMRSAPHNHAAFGCLRSYRQRSNPLQLLRNPVPSSHGKGVIFLIRLDFGEGRMERDAGR